MIILFLFLRLNFQVYYPFRIHADALEALESPGLYQGLLITGLIFLLVVLPSYYLSTTFLFAILAINLLYFIALFLFYKKFISLQCPRFLIILSIVFFGFNSLITIQLSEISKDSFLMVFLLFFIYVLWKLYDEIKIGRLSNLTLFWFSLLFILLSEIRANYLIVLSIFIFLFFFYSYIKKTFSIYRQIFYSSFICFMIVLVLNQCFIFFGTNHRPTGENLSIPLQMLSKVINSENSVLSNEQYISILNIWDGSKVGYTPGDSNYVKSLDEESSAITTILPLTLSVCSKNISICLSAWFDQTRIVYLPTYSFRGLDLMGYEMSYNPKINYVQDREVQIRDERNTEFYYMYNSKLRDPKYVLQIFIDPKLTKIIYQIHTKFQFPIWFYFWFYFIITCGFFVRHKFFYHSRLDLLIGSILAIVWSDYLYIFCGIPAYNSFYFTTMVVCFPLICLLIAIPSKFFLKKKLFEYRTTNPSSYQRSHSSNHDIDNLSQNKVAISR